MDLEGVWGGGNWPLLLLVYTFHDYENNLLVYNMREERFWFPNVVTFDSDSPGPELYTHSLVSLSLVIVKL